MDAKTIRKQLKNVIQQEMDGIVSSEVALAIEKRVLARLDARIDVLQKNLTEALKLLDERSKAVQSFLVRAATTVVKPEMDTPLAPQNAPAPKDEE